MGDYTKEQRAGPRGGTKKRNLQQAMKADKGGKQGFLKGFPAASLGTSGNMLLGKTALHREV